MPALRYNSTFNILQVLRIGHVFFRSSLFSVMTLPLRTDPPTLSNLLQAYLSDKFSVYPLLENMPLIYRSSSVPCTTTLLPQDI